MKHDLLASSADTKISVIVPIHAYFVAGVRDFVMSFIKNTTDFSEKWGYRFQSIVDELCNNAIEHGSKTGDNIVINLESIKRQKLIVSVEDCGHGEKKTAAEMNDFIKQKLSENAKNVLKGYAIRERGLAQIVHNWVDSLEFFDFKGGLKVQVTKNLKN